MAFFKYETPLNFADLDLQKLSSNLSTQEESTFAQPYAPYGLSLFAKDLVKTDQNKGHRAPRPYSAEPKNFPKLAPPAGLNLYLEARDKINHAENNKALLFKHYVDIWQKKELACSLAWLKLPAMYKKVPYNKSQPLLVNFQLSSITLTDINFSNYLLIGVDFKRSTFVNCQFNNTIFIDCDLQEIKLDNCSMVIANAKENKKINKDTVILTGFVKI